MSKWIKLEDAINDLNDLLDYLFADDIKTPTALKQVKADLLNLPTIEINEYANKDEAFMKGYAKGSIEGYVEGRASVEVGKDCISRVKAIEEVNMLPNTDNGYSDTYDKAYIISVLEKLPSIVPQEKIGKWVKVSGYATPGGDPVWECSECGKGRHVYGIEASSYQRDVSNQQWVACPNCGARMSK